MATITTEGQQVFDRALADSIIEGQFMRLEELVSEHPDFDVPGKVLVARHVPFADLPWRQRIVLRVEYFTANSALSPGRWTRGIEPFPTWHVPDEPEIPPV